MTSFHQLNQDTLFTILEFHGKSSYKTFALISKKCNELFTTKTTLKEPAKQTHVGLLPSSHVNDLYEKCIIKYEMVFRDIKKEFYIPLAYGIVCLGRRDLFEWSLNNNRGDDVMQSQICYMASKYGCVDILEDVYNSSKENRDIMRTCHFGIFECAIQEGQLEVLQFLFTDSKKYFMRKRSSNNSNSSMYINRAVVHGQLKSLIWLHENVPGCFFGHMNCYHAAHNGRLDILSYLRSKGCPWDARRCCHAVHQSKLLSWEKKQEIIDWIDTHDGE